MTEDTDLDDANDSDESLEDVTAALESTGAIAPEDDEPEAEGETSEDDGSPLPGPLGALESLQGTGKDIESYADSPIAEAVGPDGSKGGMHIARGIDGLSPLGAMNPIMDIFIGLILLKIESDGAGFGDSESADDMKMEPDESEPGHGRRTGAGGEYDDLT